MHIQTQGIFSSANTTYLKLDHCEVYCFYFGLLSGIISFNHPFVYSIELSNPSCLTVVCKRGSVEFTDTVKQRGLESSLRHTQGF